MSSGTTINVIVAGQDQLSAILNGAVASVNTFANAAGEGGPKFSSFEQVTVGALRNIGAAAVDMAARGLQAIGSFGADSIKVAGDFEAGMNTFAAAAGDSLAAAGLSADDFRTKFIQIGAELPVSTAAVQEAATTLIKGGLDPMVVKMGGLESSIKFAAAAGMDLNAAAELSIKQLGTFVPITATAAEQTQFLADAQDLLVKAAGASTLDVDKLGAAMLAAGGQAKVSGVDYQDFVTTMGMISPAFDSAATAGTSFKNFLARLQPTTAPAADAFKQLGLTSLDTTKMMQILRENGMEPISTEGGALYNQLLRMYQGMGILSPNVKEAGEGMAEMAQEMGLVQNAFYNADGSLKNMREIAEVLKGSLNGLSDAERSAALQAIFGNDAMGAAAALAANGAEGYDKFAAAMVKASGVEATAKTVQQGFNIALDNMHGSVEALQIVLGTALLPVLTFLLNNLISPGIGFVTQFALAMVSGGEALASLPPILQSVVAFFEQLWIAEGALEEAFFSAGTNSLAFGQALDQLGTALGLPVGMLSGISFAIQDFIALVYPAADAIGAFVLGMGDLGTVGATLSVLFGTTIGTLITQAIAVLNNYATVWIDLGTTIFNVVAALLSGDLAGAWSALTSGLAQVVLDYQTYASSLGLLIGNIAQTIITAVMTYAPVIATQVLTWGAAFVDWITPYAALALTTLNTWLLGLWAWVQQQAPGWLVQLGSWGLAFVNWATPYLGLALTTLGTWLAGAWIWVQQQAPGWLAQLASWGLAFVNWATPYLGLALAALGGWLAGAWAWVQQQAPGWLAQLGVWGAALAGWIGPAIPLALAALTGLGTSILGWIGQQAGPLLGAFGTWAGSVVAWIPGATVSFLGAWPGMLGSFLDWIAGAVGPILAQLGTWAIAFVQWILPMIPPFLAGLGALLGALLAFVAETAVVLIAKLVTWGLAFLGWIATNVLPALPGLLATILAGIVSFIAGAVAGITVGVAGWAIAIVSWVKEGVTKTTTALVGLGAAIGDWIRGAAGSIADQATSIGSSLVDGIKDGVSRAWGRFTSWISEQVSKIPAPIREALGIHSPSRVMAETVGQPLAQGIGQGFGQALPKVEKNLINGIAGLSEAAAKALDAGSKAIATAASYSGAGGGGLSGFLADFGVMANAFNDAAVSLGGRILGTATRFADTIGKVGEGVGKAVAGLEALGTMVAPGRTAVLDFTATLSFVLTALNDAGMSFAAGSWKAAVTFAEGAAKVLAVVQPAVTALASLDSFVRPVPGRIQVFTDVLYWLISRFALAGSAFRSEGLAAAANFAQASAGVLSVIQLAVDAFAALADFVRPVPGRIQIFTDVLYWLISRFAIAGAALRGGGLSAAVALADAASKILGVIQLAVDGMAALDEFVRPVPGRIQVFTDVLYWLVSRFALAGAALRGAGMAAASAVAEAIGKIVGIIGPAIDGLKALNEFRATHTYYINLFASNLAELMTAFLGAMRKFSADAMAAGGAFADGAGKLIGLIAPAIAGLQALGEFRATHTYYLNLFAGNLAELISAFLAATEQFSADAIAAGATFADGAGKLIGLIGPAVDGLTKIGSFVAPAESAVSAFIRSLADLLERMDVYFGDFSTRLLASLAGFGEGIQKALGFIGTAVDGLTKIGTFVAPAETAVGGFLVSLADLLERMDVFFGDFSGRLLASLASFGEGMQKAVGFIGEAVDGLAKIGDLKPVAEGSIALFVSLVNQLMTDLSAAASHFSLDAIAAAGKFADSANSAVGIIEKGVDGFLKISTFTGVSEAAITRFADGVRLAVAAMVRLAGEFGSDATAAAKAFAVAAGESTDFLKKGVDGFKKLQEIEGIPTAGLKLFEAAIILLVQTMVRLAGVISVQMLADATRIANATDAVITVLKDAIKGLLTLGSATEAIPGAITAFVVGVTGLATKMGNAVIPPAGDVGKQLIGAVATGAIGAIPAAVAQMGAMQAALLNVLATIRIALAGPSLTIGQQIALGIAQGIGAGTPAIVNAVYAAVNAALAAARAALGIHSPSTVFDQQIGQMGGAGLARGLERSIPTVAAAASNLANATIAPAQAPIAGIAPRAAQPTSVNSSRSVTLQVAPGAIVVHANPGESGPATAERGLDRLEEILRQATAS